MAFTGKATYTAGAGLPEIAEDVSDLVAINSPHETTLLDALGDPPRAARSTVHEWLEDALLANTDAVNDATIANPAAETSFGVEHAERFRAGDQIRQAGDAEIMLVTAVDTGADSITVTRGYGGTAPGTLTDGAVIEIIGNAALEGDDAGASRHATRSRKTNWTQIFSATVEVSGSELAVRQLGVADEMDWQKQLRLRELMRDLENSVINGRSPASGQQGSPTLRRTMNGILASLASNLFVKGESGFNNDETFSEAALNEALRAIWKSSNGHVDLIVVNGREKRAINGFVASNRRFTSETETFKDMVSVYESDFGLCRVVLSRHVPQGKVLLLDSSRIDVLPLAGRSFAYKPLAVTGDRAAGQIVGEYTLEVRNENAHGVISGW